MATNEGALGVVSTAPHTMCQCIDERYPVNATDSYESVVKSKSDDQYPSIFCDSYLNGANFYFHGKDRNTENISLCEWMFTEGQFSLREPS